MHGGRDGERKYSAPRPPLPSIATFLFFAFLFVIPTYYIVAGASVDDFITLLLTPRIQRVAFNTFIQALLSTAPAIALALPVAYFLAKYSFRGGLILRTILLVPFFTPAFAYAEALFIMFGYKGIVNAFLMELLKLPEPPLYILYSMDAVVLSHIFYYTPLAILLLEGGFASIDQEVLDAAAVSGAGFRKTVRKVVLYQLTPSISAASALIFVFSYLTLATPYLVGGNFYTLELEIFYYWSKGGGWVPARSLSLVQLAINIIFIVLVFWARERVFQVKKAGRIAGMDKVRLGVSSLSPKLLLLLIWVLFVSVFEGLPIYLIFMSSISPDLTTLLPSQLTTRNFDKLLAHDFGAAITFESSIGLSIAIAVVASTVTVVASLLTAHTAVNARGILRTSMAAFTSAPLAVSSTALALGFLAAFGSGILGLYGRWQLIALAHMLYVYPLATRMIESALLKLDPDLVDAALASGASRLYAFLRVELPLIWRTLVATTLIAFAASVSEFTYALVFSAPGLQTMPVLISRLLDSPLPLLDLASAGITIIIGVVLISALVANIVARKRVGAVI